MLSIITVYSSDRFNQLLQQETYMVRYEDWRNSERIIVLDGDEIPPSLNAKVLKYERDGKPFNFKLAWDMGIKASTQTNLLLIDSDRLLDKKFLTAAKNTLDYQISYPRRIKNLKEDIEDIEAFDPNIRMKAQSISHRYARQSQRSPASGNMALTTITYNYINRQVDERQLSWGYTDYDFTEKARRAKIAFNPIDTTAIHLKHGYNIPIHVFVSLNLKNGISHYKKYNLPLPRHLRHYIDKYDLDVDLIESMPYEEVMAGNLHEGAKRKSI
jgi:hypothetical protein